MTYGGSNLSEILGLLPFLRSLSFICIGNTHSFAPTVSNCPLGQFQLKPLDNVRILS